MLFWNETVLPSAPWRWLISCNDAQCCVWGLIWFWFDFRPCASICVILLALNSPAALALLCSSHSKAAVLSCPGGNLSSLPRGAQVPLGSRYPFRIQDRVRRLAVIIRRDSAAREPSQSNRASARRLELQILPLIKCRARRYVRNTPDADAQIGYWCLAAETGLDLCADT